MMIIAWMILFCFSSCSASSQKNVQQRIILIDISQLRSGEKSSVQDYQNHREQGDTSLFVQFLQREQSLEELQDKEAINLAAGWQKIADKSSKKFTQPL